MKQQANRERREAEMWKAGDKVMLSMKDLVFKEKLAKKLIDCYVGPYIIDEVVSSINQCSQMTTTCFNEDTSGGKCQSNSMIQGASGKAEERRSKTSRDGQSREIKQKKSKGSSKILGMI